MKKSLFALAALTAFAGAAQAQSSVTLYGVMDAGIATFNNAAAGVGNFTGLANGGLSTSRFGFKGTEDLGGGLSANFRLESQLFPTNGSAGADVKNTANNTQSGTVNASTLFSRNATVGFAGAFGSVDIGRANTIAYDKAVEFDPMGYGNFGAVGSFSPAFISRVNNQVKYYSPMINGVQGGLAYSTLGVAGQSSAGTTQEATLSYAANGLKLFAAYGLTKTVDNTTAVIYNADYAKQYGAVTANGQDGVENWQLGAVYTTGQYTLNAGYSTKKDKSSVATGGTNSKDLFYVGVGYAINPVNKVTVAYYDYNNKTANSGAGAKSNMVSIQYKHSLSKRTDLYVIGASLHNDSGASLGLGDNSNVFVPGGTSSTQANPAAGQNQTGAMVGVRHMF